MNTVESQKRWIDSPKGVAYRKSKEFRESIKKYNRKRDRTHREETQRRTRAIKIEKGCLNCGFKEHPAALDFHHRDPNIKKFRPSESRNWSWETVEAEIAKCDVLCANCHRILEYDKRVLASTAISSGRIRPS